MSIRVLKRDNNEQIGALVCLSGVGTAALVGPFNYEGKLLVTSGQVQIDSEGSTTISGADGGSLGLTTVTSGSIITVESLTEKSSFYLDINIKVDNYMQFTASPDIEWSFTTGAIREVT